MTSSILLAALSVVNFNSGWEWHPGDAKSWRSVDLPHDFMFESPWDAKAVHSQRVFKPLGEARYRKMFDYDKAWDGRRVILDFGGIMFFGDVKVNAIGAGLFPGVAVNLNDKISFVTKIGALSYVHASTKRNDVKVKGDEFNVGIDGSNLQFSVYYNF